ncbi:anti-sigma-I factor RsgI family protein [Fictibacillus terranigra]|uniref:RsgI N-terminal anti-sigma domain-containing protein n=1 Tax=Fictibacillus terranigra TaxID=3058424 RepID=A0ABT8E3C0_9BACL|nr:hypothetical protein [Fictibacillus sp. CENA-BCM004]MDN4072413.1 hypothetical protein [Fictibacillus sp. CENA-BCM004]
MTKGIVVEVKRRHLIVLSEGGIFRKVKVSNRQYSVGSDIYLPNESEKQRAVLLPAIRWKTATVFVMALILLLFQFAPYTGQGVYAYVGIEMNPSIELEIDDDLLVQNINAYNADGKKIVAILEDWKNQPIEKVTEKIFEICRAKGFIKPNQEVIVTTTINKDVSKKIQRKIEQKINSLMEKKAQENQIDMTSLIMSYQERKQAKKIGVSPGKYAIFMAAKEAGIHITKADIKLKSIQELSEVVGSISDLLSTAQSNEYHDVAVYVHIEPAAGQTTAIPKTVNDDSLTIVADPAIVKAAEPVPAVNEPGAPSGSSDQKTSPASSSTPPPYAGNVKAPADEVKSNGDGQATTPSAQPSSSVSVPERAAPSPASANETAKPAEPVPAPAASSKPDAIIPAATEKESGKPAPPPAKEEIKKPAAVPVKEKEETKPEEKCNKEENQNTDSAKHGGTDTKTDRSASTVPANGRADSTLTKTSDESPSKESGQEESQRKPTLSSEDTSSPEAVVPETSPSTEKIGTAGPDELSSSDETPLPDSEDRFAPSVDSPHEEPLAANETPVAQDETVPASETNVTEKAAKEQADSSVSKEFIPLTTR